MNNDNNKNAEKDTVGEVGSSLEGGFEENSKNDSEVTNKDLKGKKVDADPSEEQGKPAQ